MDALTKELHDLAAAVHLNTTAVAVLTEQLRHHRATLDTALNDHDELLDRHSTTLYGDGNGVRGLHSRVIDLEEREDERSESEQETRRSVREVVVDCLKQLVVPLVAGLVAGAGVAKVARGQELSPQYRGISSYAALSPAFPCDDFLSIAAQSPRPAMAILWSTFGNDWTCALKFTTAFHDRPHLIEVHFTNEVCRRNHRCDTNEFHPEWGVNDYNKALERIGLTQYAPFLYDVINRVLDVSAFATAIGNTNTTFVLSAGLEDNYTQLAYTLLHRAISAVWTGPTARNPGYRARGRGRGDAEFLETHHGKVKPPCIANEDGDLRPSSRKSKAFLRTHRACDAVFLWRPKHQGIEGSKFKAPLKRKFKIPATDVPKLGALLK